jgi:phospholipid/cholesterol/gamma-HCH transport system ATP-binding protein
MAFIRIEDVHKSFGEQKVLDGISLEIEKGQSVVVIGRSGSGKSVLLKHVIRLMDPDSGSILVDDQDISELNGSGLSTFRRRFGMLFQGAALFDSLSVWENIALGLKESRQYDNDEIDQMVSEKLDMVGLKSAVDKFPAELSGGMRKRVGLARAIVHNPEILLYDEPTTGLDPITSDMIDNLISNLNDKLNVTSIAVTHDMRSAFKIADRIVMLYKGKIHFDGTPDEVQSSDNAVVQQFISGEEEGPVEVG